MSICFISGSFAAELPALSREALAAVRPLVVQHRGREKPFDSFAWETLQSITGSPRFGREDPVATALAILADDAHWRQVPLIAVPFRPLREAIGLAPTTSHVSYNDLVSTRRLMRMLPAIVAKQQRDEKLTMLEQETMDAYERFVAVSHLLEQDVTLAPSPPGSSDRAWRPILHAEGYSEGQQTALRVAWAGLMTAAREGDSARVTRAARELAATLHGLNPTAYPPVWRIRLELAYNRVAPFTAARGIYFLAILGLALGVTSARRRRAAALGLTALGIAFLAHGAGIVMRVVIGGRPPVSNFYETTLWLPFVAVGLALIFERIYRVRYFGLAAAILAAIMLVLADHLPLDPSISPVVAVLRSNLWLTIHVLTIVASYGALGLATVLAHLYGGFSLVHRAPHPALERLGFFLYRAIQVGVVLLAAGVMLGAVWANASWGRYWGWDPKETWALITLLWFLAVLHGRFAGWLAGIGVALATIAGFFLLLMTYYGVSFYLVGLHSYAGGSAKPLPPLLIAYLAGELLFVAAVGARAVRGTSPV